MKFIYLRTPYVIYDICLAFSLAECQTFIVNGWFGESGTIVYNVVTRWHHLLVVLGSKLNLPKQTEMSIAICIWC